MFGQCDYATEDWYCVKREGHDGPHESTSLGTTIDTAVGMVDVMPECKRQAVCVNGRRCWEAGECLRATASTRKDPS